MSTDTGQTPHTAPMFRMSSRLVTVVAKHARDRPRRVDVRHLAKPRLKAPQSNQTKQTNQYSYTQALGVIIVPWHWRTTR